jgi:sulfur carrier protein ThiS
MKIYLGGHLNWYKPHKRKSIAFHLILPTLLMDVLAQLKVPIGEVAIGVVNGHAVFSFENVRVQDTDKVELYPPVDGGG